MIRKLGCVFIGCFMISQVLLGCERLPDISIEQIKQELALAVDSTLVKEGGIKELRRFIGVNPNEIEGFVYYVSQSAMDVEEVLVIEVINRDQLETIETLVETRVNDQINRFSGYKPENCGLLDNYEIKIRGNFIFFVVSKDVESLTDTFVNMFRK